MEIIQIAGMSLSNLMVTQTCQKPTGWRLEFSKIYTETSHCPYEANQYGVVRVITMGYDRMNKKYLHLKTYKIK